MRAAIVVTSGDRDGVTASVASALDQTAPDVEVVVVAAGAATRLDLDDARIRFVEGGGTDFAGQVNAALATVRAPLVKIVPAGDRLAPQCIAAQAEALALRPDVGVVFSLAETIDAAGRISGESRAHATAARTRDELLPALLGDLEIAVASALVRREILLDEGGLDPLYTTRAAAHDLWLRVLPRFEGLLLADRSARVRATREADRVERTERAVAQLRALEREGTGRFLAALGAGPDDPPRAGAAARLALADTMLAADEPALVPFVHRLVGEACELGAAVGSVRAARLAAAGLAGFSPAGTAPARAPLSLAFIASGDRAEGLAARRRSLARARVEVAAEHGAWAALGRLGRDLSERIAHPGSAEASTSVDPRPLVELSVRIAALSDEILARLRVGRLFRRAVPAAPTGSTRDGRPSDPTTPGGESA